MLGASHCAVAKLDPEGRRLLGSIATEGGQATAEPFVILLADEPATAAALSDEQPVMLSDTADSRSAGQQQLFQRWGMRSCLVIPLLARQRAIGALYLGDTRPHITFGEPERQLGLSFAYFAATAIENARSTRKPGKKQRTGGGRGRHRRRGARDRSAPLPAPDEPGRHAHLWPAAATGMPMSDLLPGSPLLALIEETLSSTEEPIVRELELMTARDGRTHWSWSA
ncbi:GAF domain-containing protein [Candidatus Amarolinea dominans]|uniref:GAF domain-containing protein n=1 Tax=Candidatus Amarolinea dominans TaxID=3140696 RepID=UPI0031370177|nr:GAF domain-containing protein [Anaerolineae bacterium]